VARPITIVKWFENKFFLRKQFVCWIAFILVLGCLVVIWLRTGLVPAASGGDEVWWSESGYQFLHEGVLRWHCLSDAKGSGFMSFWPPVAPLLQAAMMKVFGVTAFGIYAQSSLVCTLVMSVVYVLCRSLNIDRLNSLFATLCVFGAFMVCRRLVQVRMENLTALATATVAWLVIRAASARTNRKQQMLGIAAGIVIGIGVFCYYPQSPFFVLACFAAIFTLPQNRTFRFGIAVAAGVLPAVVLGAFWILPHWRLFTDQVLQTGSEHYVSLFNTRSVVTRLGNLSDFEIWIQQVEKWVFMALAVFMWQTSRRPSVQMVSVMAVVSSLPMFFYGVLSPQVSEGVLGIVLIFALYAEAGVSRSAGLLRAGKCYLIFVACLNVALMGFTALYQREGRRYDSVAKALQEVIQPGRPVAISQRGWLALRVMCKPGDLHLLVYAGPSLENMPIQTKRPDADDYFQYLVIDRANVATLINIYPWLRRALNSNEYHLVREISPIFKFLPWAKLRCYDLLVYERTNP
jgi:4-amino-4-deoxy-L-arabinose transferase-like glycosyltransferase